MYGFVRSRLPKQGRVAAILTAAWIEISKDSLMRYWQICVAFSLILDFLSITSMSPGFCYRRPLRGLDH